MNSGATTITVSNTCVCCVLLRQLNPYAQGSLVFVAHILDREKIEFARMNDCQRLCSVLDTQARNFGANSQHVALLERQITQQCQPTDVYIGCTYTTISFDVLN